MTLIDNIIKWFKAPKTLYGIAGMIVIIIVLALDFAYWAGAIDVGSPSSGSNGGGDDDEVVLPDDYLETHTDSLEHGRMIAPQVPHPQGEGEGVTYNLYSVPVESNRSEIEIVSSGDGGSPPRIDGGDRNDIDLYLYKPGKNAGGDFDSTEPDYEAATQYIDEGLSEDKLEPGNWTLRVECYTGNNFQYTVEIQILYALGNETEEGE